MQTQHVFDVMSHPWLRPSIQTPRQIARMVELQFVPYRATLQVMQAVARGADELRARLSLLPAAPGAQASASKSSNDLRNFSR